MVLKRKQIITAILLVMIAVAGYLNWAYKKDDTNVQVNAPDKTQTEQAGKKLGDSAMVSGQQPVGSTSDVLNSARKEKEAARSKSMELLTAIVSNQKATKEAKDKAGADLTAIAKAIEKEGVIQGIIKTKGFEDSLVFLSDGKANVTVKVKATLSSADVAKLQDIVSENAGITADKIKISEVK